MKRGTLFLRIASVVYALYTVGHTYGAMYEDVRDGDPLKQAVFAAMRTYTERIQGFSHSYWDFYRGFGFLVSWTWLLFTILCWQLSTLSRTQPASARPFVLTLFLISVPMSALAWTNFFAAPGILSTLATALLGAAYLTLP
jgi:hypothetical protein